MPDITDFDAETIRNAADHLKGGRSIVKCDVYGRFLIDLAERLTPVKWTEAVPGVHVASFNGWSMVVGPFLTKEYYCTASRTGRPIAFHLEDFKTIDAAMSAAVEWARKHPVEAK